MLARGTEIKRLKPMKTSKGKLMERGEGWDPCRLASRIALAYAMESSGRYYVIALLLTWEVWGMFRPRAAVILTNSFLRGAFRTPRKVS